MKGVLLYIEEPEVEDIVFLLAEASPPLRFVTDSLTVETFQEGLKAFRPFLGVRLLKARPLPEALGTALHALGNITEDWGAVYREVAEKASRHLPHQGPLEALLEEAPRALARALLEVAEEALKRGWVEEEGSLEDALLALAQLGEEEARRLLALFRL